MKSSDYVSEERDRENRNTRMTGRRYGLTIGLKGKPVRARRITWAGIGDVRNIPTQLQQNVYFLFTFPQFYFSPPPNVNEEPPVWHGINPVVTPSFDVFSESMVDRVPVTRRPFLSLLNRFSG